MKPGPVFLTMNDVLSIHERIIREFGGSPEIKNFGLLESAVMMPAAQFGAKFLHRDIAARAGAYLFHICQNHAFVDGNKRSALAASELFLILNRRELKASNDQLVQLTLGVAAGKISKPGAIGFFRRHIRKMNRQRGIAK